MSKYTHDAVATIGEYADRQTGASKKRYVNVGKCFTDDQGRQSIKLDTIPVGPEWSGWISLYPAKEALPRTQASPSEHRQPAEKQRHERAKANHAQASEFHDSDDIPF